MGAAGETWTYQHLHDFLFAPKAFASDTKMSFGGIKNDADLANLLAYLSTLSANPVPFPAPEAATEAAAEPVATDAGAIPTPTTTQTETQVQGTPTTSGTEAAPPAADAMAPADGEPVPEVSAQQ
jgi:cytochrome c